MDGPLRVLIVDDSDAGALSSVHTLEHAGFTVTSQRVATPQAMATALTEQSWDVVLANHALQHFDGLAALKLLQDGGHDVPFILLSSAADPDIAVSAMRAGADDFVGRDHLERLAAAVERQLRDGQIRRARRRDHSASVQRDAIARAVVDNAVDGIITIDTRGTILSFNHAAERLFGYSAAEALGQSITILMPSPYREQHDSYVATYLQTAVKRIIGIGREVVGQRRDGSTFPMDLAVSEIVFGERRLFTGIVRDVTARRQTEAALRESEHRFTQFMHHLPGVAFMKDVAGRYVYVNDTFEQLFHRNLRDYTGRTDEEVWPPQVAAQLRSNDQRVVETRSVLQTTEMVPHDDGLHHWLVTKFPILNEDGTPAMVAGVAIDVTERRRAEAELRELHKVAQQRERLADIGAITAQIVHDLGNPLAGVSMQAQLILRRAGRDPNLPVSTIVKAVESILAEVRRLDSLTKEFMEFSREQRLDLKSIDVRRFLHRIVDLWQPVAGARAIALTFDAPPAVPPVTADEEKLHRVFDNLVKNAIEAIDRGPGHVAIQVTAMNANAIRIAVTDTGPGIPESVQVFRLFETTKPEGSGVGLAVARQIVLAHRGSIECARLQPRGTVFNVDLPCDGPLA